MTTQRKLTTILSADVEGYSRLMSADEEGTFSTLKSSRDVISRQIAAYDGRVVNTWGDGLIAEFSSVVSAVRAAIDIQVELAERNAGMPPNAQMKYRIGINLGDVIVDANDIYGDGVNVAARLQAEAAPGGVLISNTVYDQVRNKLAVGFEFLGDLEVKNIGEAVPAFAIRIGVSDAASAVPQAAGAARRSPAHAGWGSPRDATIDPAARPNPVSNPRSDRSRLILLMAVPALLVAANLATGRVPFWAKWPLLAFAFLVGLRWSRRRGIDRLLSLLIATAITVVLVNIFTWDGEFWGVWPFLALSAVAVLRLARSARGQDGNR
ncbi:MAG: adenylate/guanylate cyclase domain-containing protein [Rhizobiaceae bacterium]|nr:adenylate/guanylate cyclase domain-containing protein [Rhizobiaceae bacterium]